MFGSDYFGNFGLPPWPLQQMDPQGGMFGTNLPPTGMGEPFLGAPPPGTPPGGTGVGPTGTNMPGPAPAIGGNPLGGTSPAGGSPLSLGGGVLGGSNVPATGDKAFHSAMDTKMPPAAGLGSEFAKGGPLNG